MAASTATGSSGAAWRCCRALEMAKDSVFEAAVGDGGPLARRPAGAVPVDQTDHPLRIEERRRSVSRYPRPTDGPRPRRPPLRPPGLRRSGNRGRTTPARGRPGGRTAPAPPPGRSRAGAGPVTAASSASPTGRPAAAASRVPAAAEPFRGQAAVLAGRVATLAASSARIRSLRVRRHYRRWRRDAARSGRCAWRTPATAPR